MRINHVESLNKMNDSETIIRTYRIHISWNIRQLLPGVIRTREDITALWRMFYDKISSWGIQGKKHSDLFWQWLSEQNVLNPVTTGKTVFLLIKEPEKNVRICQRDPRPPEYCRGKTWF